MIINITPLFVLKNDTKVDTLCVVCLSVCLSVCLCLCLSMSASVSVCRHAHVHVHMHNCIILHHHSILL